MSDKKQELVLVAAALLFLALMIAVPVLRFQPLEEIAVPAQGTSVARSAQSRMVSGVASTAITPVAINRADLAELMRLPGIGEQRAQAILTYRAENGLFRTPEELLQVPGIGEALLAGMRDLITLE